MTGDHLNHTLPTVVADIGGTHARFAWLTPGGGVGPVTRLTTSDFAGFAVALEAFRDTTGGPRPARLCLAVAAPIIGDDVALTNAHWRFSIGELKKHLNLVDIVVANDYEALAMALPRLGAGDRRCIGPPAGEGQTGAPMAVLGPGTGLGMAGLVPVEGGWATVSSECGYIGLSPLEDRELDAFCILRERYGRVSTERVLSGPGLVDLHAALAALDGRLPGETTAAAIIRSASENPQGPAAETVLMFCNLLGGLAGDIALIFLARGGVYLAGGILPRIIDILDASSFRKRFEHKGRGSHVVSGIPTFLITHESATLLGCAEMMKPQGDGPIARAPNAKR